MSPDTSFSFQQLFELVRWMFVAFFMKTCQIDDVFLLLWASVSICKQASWARAQARAQARALARSRWILSSRCCCVFPCWVFNCSISLYKSLEFIFYWAWFCILKSISVLWKNRLWTILLSEMPDGPHHLLNGILGKMLSVVKTYSGHKHNKISYIKNACAPLPNQIGGRLTWLDLYK